MFISTYSIRKTYVAAVAAVVSVAAVFCLCLPASAMTFGIPEVEFGPQSTVLTPENLRLEESKPRSVTVHWNSDVRSILSESEQVTGATVYTVKIYGKKKGKLLETQEVVSTCATFDELKKNKVYVVKVWAKRGLTTSEPAVLVVRTAPAKAKSLSAKTVRRKVYNDVVTNKETDQFGSSGGSKYAALLKWKASEGTVRYYTVDIYKKDGETLVKSVTTKKNKVIVNGLKLKKTYKYQVTAHFNDEYSSFTSKMKKFKLKKK